MLESEKEKILFDPLFENPFSRNCYAFPSVEFDLAQIKNLRPSAIFISHYHDDHCSFESLQWLDRRTPIYIYCQHAEMFDWLRRLGFSEVHSLRLNESVQIGSLRVTPRQALDAQVDSLFQVQVNGLNILNVVDSWIDEDTLRLLVGEKPWDLILWPFQTMREMEVLSPKRAPRNPPEVPIEWKDQLKQLQPKFLVPSSCQFKMEDWSWYNQMFFPISYDFFKQEINAVLSKTEIVKMNPGESFRLTKDTINRDSRLEWVRPIGSQDLDYTYDAQTKIPATSEVAKKLGALNNDQKHQVFQYCTQGILKKYQEVGPSPDTYFQKTRLWQLSLFDHLGDSQEFFYRVYDDRLEPVQKSNHQIEWLTEIPMIKMYGALFEGESLTSIYARVNDCAFSDSVEKQVAEVDPTEDPLLRCLFNGSFGSYQQAQLQRIKFLQTF